MNFETFWKSKNEHFVWQVLRKSNFRIDEYPMLLGTDFGAILDPFGVHFWIKKRSEMDMETHLDVGALVEATNYRPGENPAREPIIEEPQFLVRIP